MIKVVRVTFDCEEEFDAKGEVVNAIRSHMIQITKKAKEVSSYDVVELSRDVIEAADRVDLAVSMDRLAETLDKYKAREVSDE